MDVVLLCAGYGTRLKPLTNNIPKPLLLVAGRPIIEYLIEPLIKRKDISRIILVSNSRFFSLFKDWASKKGYNNLVVLDDGSTTNDDRRGAIGDLLFAIESCDLSEDLLVVGGDNMWEEGLGGFLDFSKQKKKICLGVYDFGDKNLVKEFGVVLLDKNGRVVEFEEKPSIPKSSLVGICLYFFPSEKINKIYDYWEDESNPRDAIGYFLSFLVKTDEVFGYIFSGKWFDIGSISAYEKANRFFSNKGNI